jgi:TetR/AcrR family transcriptional repressor of nem operon
MGRKKKVDTQEALSRAVKVFWARGFHATTIEDLEVGTGLLKGSLYQSFGNKEKLFQLCLYHYAAEVVERRRELVRMAPTAREGIRIFFTELINISTRSKKNPGCLNTNTIVGLLPEDKKLIKTMSEKISGWEEFWIQILERHYKETKKKVPADVRFQSRHLIVLTQGLNVVSKVKRDKEYLHSIVDSALLFLGK